MSATGATGWRDQAIRSAVSSHPSKRGRWLFAASVGAVALAVFAGVFAWQRLAERRALDAMRAAVAEQMDGRGELRPLAEIARAASTNKLVTVELLTTVRATAEHESWRGGVRASVEAPARLLYGTDLSGLTEAEVTFMPVFGLYHIRVPAPERIAAEVLPGERREDLSLGWMRLRTRAGEYYLGQARDALPAEARRLALDAAQMQDVRARTREQVRKLVGAIVGGVEKVRVSFTDE